MFKLGSVSASVKNHIKRTARKARWTNLDQKSIGKSLWDLKLVRDGGTSTAEDIIPWVGSFRVSTITPSHTFTFSTERHTLKHFGNLLTWWKIKKNLFSNWFQRWHKNFRHEKEAHFVKVLKLFKDTLPVIENLSHLPLIQVYSITVQLTLGAKYLNNHKGHKRQETTAQGLIHLSVRCCVTRSKTQNFHVLGDRWQSPSCKWGRDMHPGGTGACFKYFFRFKGRSLGTRKKAGTEIHESPKETGAPRVRCDIKQFQKGALNQPQCCKQHVLACQWQHRSWSSFKTGGPQPNWRKSLYKGKKKTQPFRRAMFRITALTVGQFCRGLEM